MAAWVTVYCTRRVSQISTDELLEGIHGLGDPELAGVDYWTLADDWDLDEPLVAEARRHLHLDKASDAELDYELRFQADPDARPLVLHAWTEPHRVAEEIREAIEEREAPEALHGHLRRCVEVIGVELGWSQVNGMGMVLAYEIARYLAEEGEGLVGDDNGGWFLPRDGELEDVD